MITIITARRQEGISITDEAILKIRHEIDMDVLDALDKCLAAWFTQTKEGKSAWEYTCGDFNIGDLLCGMCPPDDFTRQFGFEILMDDADHYIDINYDRVFGEFEMEEI